MDKYLPKRMICIYYVIVCLILVANMMADVPNNITEKSSIKGAKNMFSKMLVADTLGWLNF